MIGGIIVGGLVVGTCVWMAFGDDDPRWMRGGLRNLAMVVGFFGILFVVFWALNEYGYLQ